MDPLSIIGSVAGVATAGVSLAAVIFETLDTYRNAPREISTIARGIQDVTLVLDQLVEVLSNGHDLHTKRLRTSVIAVVRRIDDVHEEVWDLIERGESGFGRIKWTLLRKGKLRDLVTRIEAHKSTIQLVCTTLLLAMQQRRVAKSREPKVAVFARRRLRRQAENLVNATHQSLFDLTEQDSSEGNGAQLPSTDAPETDATAFSPTRPLTPEIEDNNRDRRDPDRTTNSSPRRDAEQDLSKHPRNDSERTALFLYNMVFSRTVGGDFDAHETTADPSSSNALVIHNTHGTDIVLARRPLMTNVIDSLLHEWTLLSDQEIEDAADRDPEDSRQQKGERTRSPVGDFRGSRRGDTDGGREGKESNRDGDTAFPHSKAYHSRERNAATRPTTSGNASGRHRDRYGNVRGRSSRNTDRSPSNRTSYMQKAAKASLIAGAAEAFRLVKKEPKQGSRHGKRPTWVVNAAQPEAAQTTDGLTNT